MVFSISTMAAGGVVSRSEAMNHHCFGFQIPDRKDGLYFEDMHELTLMSCTESLYADET
jgi:hypothetical protein